MCSPELAAASSSDYVVQYLYNLKVRPASLFGDPQEWEWIRDLMGRAPCCAKVGLHRGPWSPREDTLLVNYIQAHGEGHWRNLPKKAGLLRCGKSCRLRWMNYLRPDIKRGNIAPDEDDLIIRLHSLLGNRWSLIAGRLPGRTDNEIKNYWNTHLGKKFRIRGADKGLTETLQQAGAKRRRATKPAGQARRQRRGVAAKNRGAHGRVEKSKLHLPKAIRVTSSFPLPRNDSFMSNMVSGCTSCNQGSGQGNYDDRQDGNRRGSGSGAEFVVGVEGLHGEEGGGGRDEGGLEKLYEEYLELLRAGQDQKQDQDLAELDCFAESLLDLL